ncbi:MAG TPA: MBL fold metallo-hydrolase [Acidimicrobiia bacterium]|jgi:glyoxylase-like metal-dependent hydrolase (beta-lactamase superfamily II)
MLVVRVEAWYAQTNAYLVAGEEGGAALAVDAPPDPDLIGSALVDHGLSLAGILLTHGHVDHTGGSGRLAKDTGAAVLVHPDDDFLTMHPVEQVMAMFGSLPPGSYDVPEVITELGDGQMLEIAGLEIEVRHTPGHTPGHCCFYLEAEETLFSGDQLFAGSIGRTDFPYGSHSALMTSMRDKVLVLPDETRVLPGHGPETTIGRERVTNPFLT